MTYQNFSIELPEGLSAEKIEALAEQVNTVPGVGAAGTTGARSLDPLSLAVWVKLAIEIATAVGTAVPVIGKVIDLLRREGIKGARLTFADGTVLEVDSISAEDLRRLLPAS